LQFIPSGGSPPVLQFSFFIFNYQISFFSGMMIVVRETVKQQSHENTSENYHDCPDECRIMDVATESIGTISRDYIPGFLRSVKSVWRMGL
jgi:hypothetical protein